MKAIFPAPRPCFLKSRMRFRLINRDVLLCSTNGLSLTAYTLYRKEIFLRWKDFLKSCWESSLTIQGEVQSVTWVETFSFIKRKLVKKRTQHNHIKFDFEKVTVLFKTCVYLRLQVSPSLVQTHILKCKLRVKVEPGTVVLHWGTGMWAGLFRYTSDTRNP